jgi:cathepsin L
MIHIVTSWFTIYLITWKVLSCEAATILLDESSYSFELFMETFNKHYDDLNEYKKREEIFYRNLQTIVNHNRLQQDQQLLRGKPAGGYVMGVNVWADRTPDELHTGYNKYQSTTRMMLQKQKNKINGGTIQISRQRRDLEQQRQQLLLDKLPIAMIEPVQDLPKSVDWRRKQVTTPVKNQGQCGSCWAFASTAVLESHIALQTGVLFELSPQELVSCASNPSHCGGTGGCTGATAELAYDLVKAHGMVQEWTFGYADAFGAPVNCSLPMVQDPETNQWRFRLAAAGIVDYAVLPSNNYTVLMNVVAKLGPVAVSVACMPWHLYQSGVFYQPMTGGSSTDLNHLVVLEGYETDPDTNEEYWIVRNSWGPLWGEAGYIRLKRVGEEECGLDETPADGTACTLDPDGNEITPEPQKICGNSGILFDSTIPLGGYLM